MGMLLPGQITCTAYTAQDTGFREGQDPPLRSHDIRLAENHLFHPSQTPQHPEGIFHICNANISSANTDFTHPQGGFHCIEDAINAPKPGEGHAPRNACISQGPHGFDRFPASELLGNRRRRDGDAGVPLFPKNSPKTHQSPERGTPGSDVGMGIYTKQREDGSTFI